MLGHQSVAERNKKKASSPRRSEQNLGDATSHVSVTLVCLFFNALGFFFSSRQLGDLDVNHHFSNSGGQPSWDHNE